MTKTPNRMICMLAGVKRLKVRAYTQHGWNICIVEQCSPFVAVLLVASASEYPKFLPNDLAACPFSTWQSITVKMTLCK